MACELCTSSDNMRRYYIIPLKLGGDKSPSNTITLCAKCRYRIDMTYGISPADYLPQDKLDRFLELPKAQKFLELCKCQRESSRVIGLIRDIKDELRSV